jgi:hypothetical protein
LQARFIYLWLGRCCASVIDALCALFLACYALLLGSLGFLKGPLVLDRIFWYWWILSSQGLLTTAIKIAIEWRLGNFGVAISQAEVLTTILEKYYKQKSRSLVRFRVLADFYTLLARAYMHMGYIDEAMKIIIQAKEVLDIDRLGGLKDLDAKTARLVRAGLAAGRLVDGSGLTALFVKTDPVRDDTQIDKKKGEEKSKKASAVKEKDSSNKVIPFPRLEPVD